MKKIILSTGFELLSNYKKEAERFAKENDLDVNRIYNKNILYFAIKDKGIFLTFNKRNEEVLISQNFKNGEAQPLFFGYIKTKEDLNKIMSLVKIDEKNFEPINI